MKPAWKAWTIWKTCGRKQLAFEHGGQARREAHKRGMRSYVCKYCGKYHLTSLPEVAK